MQTINSLRGAIPIIEETDDEFDSPEIQFNDARNSWDDAEQFNFEFCVQFDLD